jgi:(2Fe-2S) ferredoxin
MKQVCFVCQNVDCKLRGSEKIMNELAEKVAARSLDVEVKSYLCFGGCEEGPNVVIHPQKTWYAGVKMEDLPEILNRTLAVYRIGGLLWLVGGIALVAAGLGVLGFIIPADWWRSLAIAGAAISLFMLAVYFHPITIIGTASSLAVLVALLWLHWPPASLIR